MAVTSGFFDSMDGDRKYNALQLSSIFDGLIEDGVYNNVGDKFAVTASEGNTVVIGTGRAYFNHGWILNDADLPIELDASGVTYDRYDAIILEIDQRPNIRTGNITVIKGSESRIALKPFLIQGTVKDLWQYPIAYIKRKAGSSSISQSDIEYVVGTSNCPFVVAAVQSVDIDALLAQWEDQFEQWFDNLETQLGGDVAGNLQNQINQKVDKANVIDDLGDLVANQASGMIAGAKAVAELNDNLPRFSLSEAVSTSYTPKVDGFLTINYMPADAEGIILISTIDTAASLTIGTGLSQSGTRVAYTIPVIAGRSYRTDRSIAKGTLTCRFMPLH